MCVHGFSWLGGEGSSQGKELMEECHHRGLFSPKLWVGTVGCTILLEYYLKTFIAWIESFYGLIVYISVLIVLKRNFYAIDLYTKFFMFENNYDYLYIIVFGIGDCESV